MRRFVAAPWDAFACADLADCHPGRCTGRKRRSRRR